MEEISQKEGAAVRLPYDVIVVGAGAAGMMAAGTAARNGHRVLLLEKMEKSGRKVRITGKGRCNVTNARPPEEFAGQVRTNAEFFSTAFAEFNNKATIRFFERLGVKHIYMRSAVKIHDLEDFMAKTGLKPEEILYAGDDIPDYEVMTRVGLPVAPADAAPEIKAIAGYISSREGGCGVARDVIEQTMRAQGDWFGEEAFGW